MSQTQTVAELIVKCLENEGVEYVFGIPGEENIKLVRALTAAENIRFILTRHEQGASFMADIYGRLTGRAGVCTATLGPGAINLLLGVADAQTDSSPLVALTAQVGLNRIYKESHQIVDLVAMFRPVTKWAELINTAAAVPEMLRQAFHTAQAERPGAAYLAIPEDIEGTQVPSDWQPLAVTTPTMGPPCDAAIKQVVSILKQAQNCVVLAGHGVARGAAAQALGDFVQRYQLPVATTFMAKGVLSDKSPLSLGVIGFMEHDYENFAFDKADVILSIGYELQEFAPSRINPHKDKTIIHINTFLADVDANYVPEASLVADINLAIKALDKALSAALQANNRLGLPAPAVAQIKGLVAAELQKGRDSQSFPLLPQRIVADIRAAMGDDDIVLADTGAIKMWMARLYPTYAPLSCIVSNGLSTMSFALPGALGAHLACPDKKVLAVMGDGSFLMNSQEIETAVRENIPLKVLVWVDHSYGLIKWKMDIEEGDHDSVDFTNPDFVQYAQSFGAKGYHIDSAEALLPTLHQALAEPGVSIIACPVDYSENMRLVHQLGELTIAL